MQQRSAKYAGQKKTSHMKIEIRFFKAASGIYIFQARHGITKIRFHAITEVNVTTQYIN
jgi:hypothetical protein